MAIKFDKYTGSGYIDVDIDYTEHKIENITFILREWIKKNII